MTFKRHTPFYREQVALGAEFVDRYGFAAAYHYGSIKAEHDAARERVGVFDVYGQMMIDVQGADALALLQWVTVNDVARTAVGGALYTSLCNERGGIVDDLTIFRLGPSHFWLSPTPSRLAAVTAWLERHRGDRQASIVPLGYRNAYLSIQGPRSRALLQRLTDADVSAEALAYFRFVWGTVAEVPGTMISRTGYSGELGFELFFPVEYAAHMLSALFEAGADIGIAACGLGALVTLRMEKKYPLYGLDLTEETTPYEAGLGWTVKLGKGDFVGRAALEAQRAAGVQRQLVQLACPGIQSKVAIGQPVRVGKEVVGKITSVAVGHTLGRTLALAYVPGEQASEGASVVIDHDVDATVSLKPLYDPEKHRLLG